MRYIYYIAFLVILITAAVAWGLFSKAEVKLSKPAIVINDRIITQDELDEMMTSKPHDRTREEFIDSLILNELLIQEAVDRKIYKEEPFRKSVENYYEQSLVKILLDRLYQSFHPSVTQEEIEKYRQLSGKKITVSKRIYRNRQDLNKGKKGMTKTIESPFEYLSDDLQFIVLNLDKNEWSKPFETKNGIVVYKLDKTERTGSEKSEDELDIKKVRAFIGNQKKEMLFEKWARQLKADADIWRNQ